MEGPIDMKREEELLQEHKCIDEWLKTSEASDDLELRDDPRWAELDKRYGTLDRKAIRWQAVEFMNRFLETEEVQHALGQIRNITAGGNTIQEYENPALQTGSKEAGMLLPYHNIRHTIDVMMEVVYQRLMHTLSNGKAVNETELFGQVVKAAYHDVGFAFEYKENEDMGKFIASESVKSVRSTFIPEYTSAVQQALATGIDTTKVSFPGGKFRQNITAETSELDKELAASDIANFGRTDYFNRGNEVYIEPKLADGMPMPNLLNWSDLSNNSSEDLRAWLGFTKFGLNNILRATEWPTDTAYYLYEPQKRKNIIASEERIARLEEALK